MAYTTHNFKTKKALKEAVAKGAVVTLFSPGFFPPKDNGTEFVEGPHGVHRWYAQVTVEGGRVVKVK